VFRHLGVVWIVRHVSMPFGALSSVHAWDRVAKLLLRIARVLLRFGSSTIVVWHHFSGLLFTRLALLVYVDDFHGGELPRSCEHAKWCFAR
jgi:hypothetical protein